ncbi:unnamed protein product [Rotaria sordida]|uniref:Uncharacterized protein n=1 Tax=Rotaria sordida TaxID=392033 RepID=A0A818G713_9BILA|nr:unnamed protein product [Rotaria sordida]CAF3487472.1 unnamed protein product [Rotaria sordida]
MPLSIENSSNIETSIAIELCQYHPYYLLGETIWRIGALLCVLLGMPGHVIVVIIMLNSRNRRQPVCLYFATIAIFEFVYLIIVFWLWCASLSLVRDPRAVLTCGVYYSLTIGSSNVSTLLLAAASIDRLLIVVYPSRYSIFVTRTKALVKIIFIIIFVFILIIQYHFSFYYSYLYNICEYYSYAQLWHGKIWPLIRLALLAFVPCLIICICSFVILKNRYYRRPSATSETTGTRHMRTASLLLVIYSIYYTISVMPLNILQFFHSYFFNDDTAGKTTEINCLKFSQWKMLMKFCMLLMAINYSNKFIVHYLVSMQFRRYVWNLFRKITSIPERNNKRTRSIEGSVFPIPLTILNDDPNFRQCPDKSGTYAHTTNCSLFHVCMFGIHTIYSCIDGFFFNPTNGKCQYWPFEKEIKCAEILKTMQHTDPLPIVEPIKNHDYYYHRRKSATSKCIQTGIYPDILDCSLFHYCHQNQKHEIFKCPNGLHFDPKIFMCSARQLVDCQYEPPIESTIIDDTSIIELDLICRDYAPGTHLPVANKFNEFIICGNNGKRSIRMKCKPGFNYNALTANCEMISCAMDLTLCQNNGQCIDEPENAKGFKCICSIEYQGEYCENHVELEQTTKRGINILTEEFLQFSNDFNNNNKSPTAIPYADQNIGDKINVIEKQLTANSQLSRIFHYMNNNYDQKQEINDIIKIIFISILTLISLILFSSIIFGTFICIRWILFPSIEPVGVWKTLLEESNV